MHINELHLSIPVTVGHLFSCCMDDEELLTSDINPFVVTRTFMSASGGFSQAYKFTTFKQYSQKYAKVAAQGHKM